MSFINLHYIRAAIQAKTGKRLSLRKVKRLLVREKLITADEARQLQPFNYADYFNFPHSEIDESLGIQEEEFEDDHEEAKIFAKIEQENR
jgi:hypothetical protein